jgi:hypothetical protein
MVMKITLDSDQLTKLIRDPIIIRIVSELGIASLSIAKRIIILVVVMHTLLPFQNVDAKCVQQLLLLHLLFILL